MGSMGRLPAAATKAGGEGLNDQYACPKCFEGYLESQGKESLLRCVCCSARFEPNDKVSHYISQSEQPPKPEVKK